MQGIGASFIPDLTEQRGATTTSTARENQDNGSEESFGLRMELR
jgi:hypothetical protein